MISTVQLFSSVPESGCSEDSFVIGRDHFLSSYINFVEFEHTHGWVSGSESEQSHSSVEGE
jgi:hypothetical protein